MLLSKGANTNDKANNGYSSIIAASRQGHVHVVDLLLSKGANINDKANNGWSSIIAASYQGHVNVVDLLLSKGANINDKANDGWSSIIWASDQGHVNVVDLLLSKGANINDKANDGWSSIIWASSQGHVHVVKLLLSKGANINDKDNDGTSSIIAASVKALAWAHFLKLALSSSLIIPLLTTLVYSPYVLGNMDDAWSCFYNGNQGFLVQHQVMNSPESIAKSFELYARRHSVTSLHDIDKFPPKTTQVTSEVKEKPCIAAFNMKSKTKYYLTQMELSELLNYEDSAMYYFQALIHSGINDNRLVSIVFNRNISDNHCIIQISLENDFPVLSTLEQIELYRNNDVEKSSNSWRNLAAESGIIHMKNVIKFTRIKWNAMPAVPRSLLNGY